MTAPRSGETITYTQRDGTSIQAKAVRVEGNLCWTDYGNGDVEPFIWRFAEGLNTLHDWPSRHSDAGMDE